MDKILTLAQVKELFSKGESNKKRVVLCHGVFDLVHPGHLEHFNQARRLGEILVVTITADRFIRKGPNRPYFNQDRRASFLAAIEHIDYVYIVESDSALEAIRIFQPDFYVKGQDYKVLESDITGKIKEEKNEVERFGGKLVFTDGFTSSSTMLINSTLNPQNREIRNWITSFKNLFQVNVVLEWVDRLKEVEVNIVGETIIDMYTDCKPLAKSSKDPLLAFHRFNTSIFSGGALAIADSCASWSKQANVFTVQGSDYEKILEGSERNLKYQEYALSLDDRPTIVKHRFVDTISGNRVFEYYDYNSDYLDSNAQRNFWQMVSTKIKTNALFVLADYGHGLFSDDLVRNFIKSNVFLAVNTQANAGNRGFNSFSKYQRMDLLSLNGAELELELRKKNINHAEVVPQIMRQKGCRNAIVTLGASGLLVFDSSGAFSHTPAFTNNVIDKVGAGDSVLAISSLLSYLAAPKEIIGLLSSVVAAYEVSQLGHKESISLVDIKKYVNGLLG